MSQTLTQGVTACDITGDDIFDNLFGEQWHIEDLHAILTDRPSRIEVHIERVIEASIILSAHCQCAVPYTQDDSLQTIHLRDITRQEAIVIFECLTAIGEIESGRHFRWRESVIGVGRTENESVYIRGMLLHVLVLVGVRVRNALSDAFQSYTAQNQRDGEDKYFLYKLLHMVGL